MLVYDKESLKRALKRGERNIEIQGSYAKELMQKYSQYLMDDSEIGLSPAIAVSLIYQKLCSPIIKPYWVERLRHYEVELYSKTRLVLERSL